MTSGPRVPTVIPAKAGIQSGFHTAPRLARRMESRFRGNDGECAGMTVSR
jgi:hypothetical protein